MKNIALSDLHPHPKNPRLAPRDDVVEQIAAQITAAGEFDQAHALIVRKNASGFEIISGHHRHLAAQKAGLKSVPCWVREMSDADAYMALALNNAQGELHPLEEGMHALDAKELHGIELKAYGEQIGKPKQTMQDRVYAARVAASTDIRTDLRPHWAALAVLHPAPSWLWPALVSRLVEDGWTVDAARRAAKHMKGIEAPPEWADAEAIAEAVVAGEMTPADVARFGARLEQAKATLQRGEIEAESLATQLCERIVQAEPSRLSEVEEICLAIEEEQAEMVREKNRAEAEEQKRKEDAAKRLARYRRVISLEEWKELPAGDRADLMTFDDGSANFHPQSSKAIEWAQFSWNPITGCLHECPYCYARDLALDPNKLGKTEAYSHGFAPAYHATTLLAPRTMKVPSTAKEDTRFRNVFVCSMADLFGRWVPAEWIEAVLREIRNAPQWNFLCLTKFPKRMAEFDIPENAWMGTTVDCQQRVAAAEAAFAKVKSKVRWLSVEPMLTPLKFKHLDRFNWVVIGGSSPSSKTPKWVPPSKWVIDLIMEARAASAKVYMKSNVGIEKRIMEMPFNAPMPEEQPLPAVFNYLGKGGTE